MRQKEAELSFIVGACVIRCCYVLGLGGKLICVCDNRDRGPVLYDVKSQVLGPLLRIAFQTQHFPPLVAPSYADGKRLMCAPGQKRGRHVSGIALINKLTAGS